MSGPPPAVRGALAVGAVLAVLAALPAAAQDAAGLVTSHEAARASGRLGTVLVRATTDPSTPLGSERPVERVAVSLLPWSPGLEAGLEAIKAGSRDSIGRFLRTSGEIQAARRSWEVEVLTAGGGGLILGADTDSMGRALLGPVPAGEWILLAWRAEAPVDAKVVPPRVRDGGGFVGNAASVAHRAVSYWKRRIVVEGGEELAVSLGDRGVWLTAVETERRPLADPPIGANPPLRR